LRVSRSVPMTDLVVRSISFVIPALNAGSTLDACLGAIRAAHPAGTRTEILLIDNGSIDETLSIAQRHGVTVVSAPGLTVAALRNLGARLADGEILAFVDADCVIAPDWLERGIAHFGDPAVGAAGSPTHVPAHATWVANTWALQRHRANQRRDVPWLPTENLLVRESAFREVGGFNETLITCEDTDLCYRLGAHYRIVNDPDIKSVHLGEAASLRAFVRKETWRGTGNLAGFLSHPFKVSELPSVVLPVYHLVCGVGFAAGVVLGITEGRWRAALTAGFLSVVPSILFALRTSIGTGRPGSLPALVLLYAAYAAARAAAIVVSVAPRRGGSRRSLRRPPKHIGNLVRPVPATTSPAGQSEASTHGVTSDV